MKKISKFPFGKGRLRGQQLTEFAAAFCVLIGVAVILIDLGVVLMRYALASNIINDVIQELAVQESLGDSFNVFAQGTNLSESLNKVAGTTMKKATLSLVATSINSPSLEVCVEESGKVPPQWLPDGSNCPCDYVLCLAVDMEISPLFVFNLIGQRIPGISAPFDIVITGKGKWENVNRNPSTGNFYLNE